MINKGKKRICGPKACVFDFINVSVFSAICILMIFPFVNVLCLSLEPEWIASQTGVIHLIPRQITFEAYKAVFQNPDISHAFFNSVFVTAVGSVLSLLVTAMMAYALSVKVPGARLVGYLLVFVMTFKIDIIPQYILVKQLGLMDSLWSLIISTLATTRNIILMRVFFEQLPDSLRESAALDGCNETTYFFKIALPLSKPIMATIALFYAEAHWNEFLKATMFIQSESKKVLQVLLREILIDNVANDAAISVTMGKNLKMATVIVTIVPILCVYPFLQKYFTKGIMIGAVKG